MKLVANAGYVALWKSNIFATDCSTIETVDRYVIEFMYFALKNIQIIIYKSQIGGAQPHIYPKELNKLHILFTEDISEQRAIAEILSDMDAEIAELEKKKEKYTSIRQGMMQQLLTGKIRLI